jgi:hypothetical protein
MGNPGSAIDAKTMHNAAVPGATEVRAATLEGRSRDTSKMPPEPRDLVR